MLTSHGHPFDPDYSGKPLGLVARCGGPSVCDSCSQEKKAYLNDPENYTPASSPQFAEMGPDAKSLLQMNLGRAVNLLWPKISLGERPDIDDLLLVKQFVDAELQRYLNGYQEEDVEDISESLDEIAEIVEDVIEEPQIEVDSFDDSDDNDDDTVWHSDQPALGEPGSGIVAISTSSPEEIDELNPTAWDPSKGPVRNAIRTGSYYEDRSAAVN